MTGVGNKKWYTINTTTFYSYTVYAKILLNSFLKQSPYYNKLKYNYINMTNTIILIELNNILFKNVFNGDKNSFY